MDRRAKAHLQRANELLLQFGEPILRKSPRIEFMKRLKDTEHIWLNAERRKPSLRYKKEIYRNTLHIAKLKRAPGYADFKVKLQTIQVPNQPDETVTMTDVVANKDIQKDEIVAYYKMRVFKTREYENDIEFYSYPNGTTYTFTVYDKNGLRIPGLIGDLSPESVPDAIAEAPFYGHLINEPQKRKDANVRVDKQTAQNFGSRESVHHGDFIIYAIVATKAIKAGERLLYCYGLDYERNYKTACSS